MRVPSSHARTHPSNQGCSHLVTITAAAYFTPLCALILVKPYQRITSFDGGIGVQKPPSPPPHKQQEKQQTDGRSRAKERKPPLPLCHGTSSVVIGNKRKKQQQNLEQNHHRHTYIGRGRLCNGDDDGSLIDGWSETTGRTLGFWLTNRRHDRCV